MGHFLRCRKYSREHSAPSPALKRLKLHAPAKINLFLHVTGRRNDGYHLLQTAFQFLEFADELEFETMEHEIIRIDHHPFDIPEKDLIISAAHRLREMASVPESCGAKITLRKRIPPGSGMGGGSANAAMTLVALNKLWCAGQTTEKLIEIAATIGADVPVFVFGHAAWAEGIGEKLVAFEPAERWYVIAIPQCSVSTERIYNHPDLIRSTPAILPGDFRFEDCQNNLEPVTSILFPEVAHTIALLADFGTPRMNGSGASVFLPCASKFQAQAVCRQVGKENPDSALQLLVTKGVNQLPHTSL